MRKLFFLSTVIGFVSLSTITFGQPPLSSGGTNSPSGVTSGDVNYPGADAAGSDTTGNGTTPAGKANAASPKPSSQPAGKTGAKASKNQNTTTTGKTGGATNEPLHVGSSEPSSK